MNIAGQYKGIYAKYIATLRGIHSPSSTSKTRLGGRGARGLELARLGT